VQNVTFNVNNVTWTTTTPLPTALTGLRAVALPVSSTSAFAVATGGFDGTNNTTTVLANTLAADGTVGANWTSITTNPLPASRAHHGMAVAHAGNSLVPVNSAFVYVIGGQANSSDTPGGTNTVFMASVNLTTGAVATWTTLSSNLPEALLGPAVTIYNGHMYVVGGLTPNGVPSADVYSAPINSDGTVGSWTTSANPYPVAVSFATTFGFGGNLYVIDGDPNSSSDPNAQGVSGIKQANFASAHNGVVGTWTATQATIKARKKHISWLSFGQVIAAEGIYDGSPGSTELERSSVNADATLASWNGITASVNQINANVYNAAAFVSPLQSASGNPRLLLLGGEAFVTTPPGAISNKVYVNNAP
jgi:N-acetylneuraminic acid mutarotase